MCRLALKCKENTGDGPWSLWLLPEERHMSFPVTEVVQVRAYKGKINERGDEYLANADNTSLNSAFKGKAGGLSLNSGLDEEPEQQLLSCPPLASMASQWQLPWGPQSHTHTPHSLSSHPLELGYQTPGHPEAGITPESLLSPGRKSWGLGDEGPLWLDLSPISRTCGHGYFLIYRAGISQW